MAWRASWSISGVSLGTAVMKHYPWLGALFQRAGGAWPAPCSRAILRATLHAEAFKPPRRIMRLESPPRITLRLCRRHPTILWQHPDTSLSTVGGIGQVAIRESGYRFRARSHPTVKF